MEEPYLCRAGAADSLDGPGVNRATPTDIFPNINIPVIAVAWQYTGLNPEETEGRITSATKEPYPRASEFGLTTRVHRGTV
jgi:hypothetical protein